MSPTMVQNSNKVANARADQVPELAQPSIEPEYRRIQVSREKKSLYFFVNLSKKFLQTDEVIELSGLGLAVTTVVTIAEILRAGGYVYIDDCQTSLVDPHPDSGSNLPKAKIQMWVRRTPEFPELTAQYMRSRPARSRRNGAHSQTHTHTGGNGHPSSPVSSQGVARPNNGANAPTGSA